MVLEMDVVLSPSSHLQQLALSLRTCRFLSLSHHSSPDSAFLLLFWTSVSLLLLTFIPSFVTWLWATLAEGLSHPATVLGENRKTYLEF